MKCLLIIGLAISCGKPNPPERGASLEWSATVAMESGPTPLREARCSPTANAVLTDLGLIRIDAVSKSIEVIAAPAPMPEHSDVPIVLDGAIVRDLATNAEVAMPVLKPSVRDFWTKAASAAVFAYVNGSSDSYAFEVFGDKEWNGKVAGTVRAASLSPDGQTLALVTTDVNQLNQLQILRLGMPMIEVGLGRASSELLAFDEKGDRIAAVRRVDAGESSRSELIIIRLDGHIVTTIELSGSGSAATYGRLGEHRWAALRGDTFWALSSKWRGAGEGIHEGTACSYVRVSLQDGKEAATEASLPEIFNARPHTRCEIRAMCPMSNGGVVLLRHDSRVLVGEAWSAAP